MRDVPPGLPILSCARYSIYILPSFTTMAGLKTSFSSQATFFFQMGSIKAPAPGVSTGFTLSTLTKGSRAQLVESDATVSAAAADLPPDCSVAELQPQHTWIISTAIE